MGAPTGGNKGSAKKGEVRNPKGRPKGCLNKSTRAFREVLTALLEANEGNLDGWLKRVAKKDAKGALDVIFKAAEFTTPKLNRTELAGIPGGAPILVTEIVDDITDADVPKAPAQGTDRDTILRDPSGDKEGTV